MMAWFRRRALAAGVRAGESANEIATHAATHSEGIRAATVISAVALLFSGYSLWETSLKQAELTVYVTNTISYARDMEGGYDVRTAGGHEVLVVPVTISNGGARDGAVVALQLDATSATGETLRFHSTYTAHAAYFGTSENLAAGAKRPKVPFAPLVVAGRSAWSGTVLFYPADLRKEKLITPKSKLEATLQTVSPAPTGWLDRLLGAPAPPVTLTLDVPEYSSQYLMTGEFARLRVATATP